MNTKQEAGNEKVTIYDIARQAGVSTTTVHKALHGQKGVSDAKRQEIFTSCAKYELRQEYRRTKPCPKRIAHWCCSRSL